MNDPTQEYLKARFDYHPDGKLISKISSGNTKKGSVIGYSRKDGYISTEFDDKLRMVHRLIYIWHYGDAGNYHIDHINSNRSDNRIENLRLVTRSQNQQNAKTRCTNTTGYKNVSYSNRKGRVRRFFSRITIDGKQKVIGYFMTAKEAHDAYVCEAIKNYGEYGNDGEKSFIFYEKDVL